MDKRYLIIAFVFVATIGIVAGITRDLVSTIFLGIVSACGTAFVTSTIIILLDQSREERQKNMNGGGI